MIGLLVWVKGQALVVDQPADHLSVEVRVLVLVRLLLHFGLPAPVKLLWALGRVVQLPQIFKVWVVDGLLNCDPFVGVEG